MAEGKPDVIVIGSGAGGLSAAVALANAGMQVLVLEQHHRAGGWCQNFERRGFSFSPGIHYIGELGEKEPFREVLEGLGVTADLSFCQLNPEGFDHVTIGDQRLDIPADRGRLVEELQQRFPKDRRRIAYYFRRMKKVNDEFNKAEKYFEGWRVLQLPFRVPNLLLFGSQRLVPFLNRVTSDPLLQSFLLAQSSACLVMPPSYTTILPTSMLTQHYATGAYYPLGGGQSIADAMVKQLERRHGTIRLSTEVMSIVVRGGRAVGVELADGERIDAPWIVSNADPEMTLGRLVDREQLPRRTLNRLERTTYSLSCLSLFLATDLDLRCMGLDSGNQLYYLRPDIEGIYKRMLRGVPNPFEFFFLSVPTLKDPSRRSDQLHTLEVMTMLPWAPFARWADRRCTRRGQEYERFKGELVRRLISLLERLIPDLGNHLVFQAAGTPLTNYHYCRAHQGAMLGTAKTGQQIANKAFPPQTELPGLLMVGASTFFPGIFGVVISGLMAASKITGRSIEELLKETGPPLKVYPAEQPEAWVSRSTK